MERNENVKFESSLPWGVAFSYARAIQQPALEIWRGKTSQVSAAQQALHHRAGCNHAARRGEYTAAMEIAELHARSGLIEARSLARKIERSAKKELTDQGAANALSAPDAKDDLKSLPMPEVEKKLGSSLEGLTQVREKSG